MSSAQLRVDGCDFERLQPKPSAPDSRSHTASLEGLRQEYGINVPYKVNDSQLPKEEPMPAPEPLPPPTQVLQPESSQPTRARAYGWSQPTAEGKPVADAMGGPLNGWAQWFEEVKGIWHACTANLRVPSEDDLAENNAIHSHSRSCPGQGPKEVQAVEHEFAYAQYGSQPAYHDSFSTRNQAQISGQTPFPDNYSSYPLVSGAQASYPSNLQSQSHQGLPTTYAEQGHHQHHCSHVAPDDEEEPDYAAMGGFRLPPTSNNNLRPTSSDGAHPYGESSSYPMHHHASSASHMELKAAGNQYSMASQASRPVHTQGRSHSEGRLYAVQGGA